MVFVQRSNYPLPEPGDLLLPAAGGTFWVLFARTSAEENNHSALATRTFIWIDINIIICISNMDVQ